MMSFPGGTLIVAASCTMFLLLWRLRHNVVTSRFSLGVLAALCPLLLFWLWCWLWVKLDINTNTLCDLSVVVHCTLEVYFLKIKTYRGAHEMGQHVVRHGRL